MPTIIVIRLYLFCTNWMEWGWTIYNFSGMAKLPYWIPNAGVNINEISCSCYSLFWQCYFILAIVQSKLDKPRPIPDIENHRKHDQTNSRLSLERSVILRFILKLTTINAMQKLEVYKFNHVSWKSPYMNIVLLCHAQILADITFIIYIKNRNYKPYFYNTYRYLFVYI